MGISVSVTNNNTDQILEELDSKKQICLELLGLKAEGYAKGYCPVDTGRLRNSISHTTDEDSAYIGTNVEYAVYVELGTVRHPQPAHFLKRAVENHASEYKTTVESILKD